MHDQWHVILHLPAEFRRNRTIVSRVMTAYRFLKMAAMESEIYLLTYMNEKFLPLYNSAKIIKIDRDLPKL